MEKADCGKFNICQQKGLREKYSKKILFIYIETVKGNTLWEVVFPTYKILGHSFPKKAYFLGTIINSLLENTSLPSRTKQHYYDLMNTFWQPKNNVLFFGLTPLKN